MVLKNYMLAFSPFSGFLSIFPYWTHIELIKVLVSSWYHCRQLAKFYCVFQFILLHMDNFAHRHLLKKICDAALMKNSKQQKRKTAMLYGILLLPWILFVCVSQWENLRTRRGELHLFFPFLQRIAVHRYVSLAGWCQGVSCFGNETTARTIVLEMKYENNMSRCTGMLWYWQFLLIFVQNQCSSFFFLFANSKKRINLTKAVKWRKICTLVQI